MNNKCLDLENARSKLELSLTASTATGSAFPREALGCDHRMKLVRASVRREVDPLCLRIVCSEDNEVRIMASDPPDLDLGILVYMPRALQKVLDS
jgi:hypothetical protein